MNRRELAEEQLLGLNPDALFMDGLNEAIVGIASQYTKPHLVVYSEQRIIAQLMRDGMSEGDAWEHYYHNIADAWVGENTPLILIELEEE